MCQTCGPVSQVTLVPQNTPLKFEQKGNHVGLALPEPNGYQTTAQQG